MAIDLIRASTQYLQVDSSPVTAVPYSIGVFGNIDALESGSTLVSIVDLSETNQYTALRAGNDALDSRIHLFRRGGGSEDNILTSTSYSAGVWFSAMAVLAAVDDAQVYLNAASEGSGSTSITTTGLDRVGVGRLVDNSPGDEADGQICRVCIWNVALNAFERSAFNLGADPRRIRPGSLQRWWEIFGLHSPEIELMGSGDELTLFNAPLQADHAPVSLFTPKWAASVPELGVAAPVDGPETIHFRSLTAISVP